MRRAVAASVALHFGVIAGAWLALNASAPPDEMGVESIAVEIISLETFLANEPSTVESSSTDTLVAAGAEAAAEPEVAAIEAVTPAEPPSEARPVEPVRDEIEPVVADAAVPETAAAEPVVAEPVASEPIAATEAVDTEALASAELLVAEPISLSPLEAPMPAEIDPITPEITAATPAARSVEAETVRVAALTQAVEMVEPQAAAATPLQTAMLQPVEEIVPEITPVPKPPKLETPKENPKDKPAENPRKPVETSADKPVEKPAENKVAPKKVANLGNGGNAEADAQASVSAGGKGKSDNGGSAAATKYPGLVQSKVTRAARYPNKAKGADGEARVSFTVGADGWVLKIALAKSTGNAELDSAALAAVERAAPFPPIPADAGRQSWSFTVPLSFHK